MSWSPEQYLVFAEPRLRPALDLLARIDLASPSRVCDLGCGAGNVTALLVQRWPGADVVGVDDSAAMLERARRTVQGVRWVQRDIAGWRAASPFDVIFSNAALHWLPDHERLLPALTGNLAPGGVLAVQMPRNFDAPSHTAIAATVQGGPWRERLAHLLGPAPVAEPAAYFKILRPHVAAIDIWQTEYLQVLEGPDPVKEWTKGTWLKRFLDALAPPEAAAFEAAYAERVRAAYPVLNDGRTLFPFRRLFIVARRNR
jgi:trans-aconitate 2-methyltransferase